MEPNPTQPNTTQTASPQANGPHVNSAQINNSQASGTKAPKRKLQLSKRNLYILGGTVCAALVIFIAAGIWLSGVNTPIDAPTDSAEPGDELDQAPQGAGGDADSAEPATDPNPTVSPSFINLQATVDTWLGSTNRQVGLMIYDLDHDRVAASYQADRVFNVASIYKLFYVYDGYRQLASGAEQGSTRFVTTSDYRADSYSIAECLDLMVRESYNGCADPMRASAARSNRVQALIAELGLTNTANLGLSSTAADLTELLKLYYEHPDLTDSLWADLSDSMLNQPATEVAAGLVYDWRQGLPSGFSVANVYDKVGWEHSASSNSWNIYADAAIVEFPELGRHYTVVVLTSGFADAKTIAKLGTAIEDAVLSYKINQ